MRRGKRISIIVGLGAVILVGGIVGNYWKEIYFVLYPEARFWGQWEIVVSPEKFKHIFEFRKNGVIGLSLEPPVDSDLPHFKTAFYTTPNPTYRVSQNRIVFAQALGTVAVDVDGLVGGGLVGDGLVGLIVTETRLADLCFSHWHARERTAVVSLADWERNSQMNPAAFVAFEILRHGLRAVNAAYDPDAIMHEVSRGCLFDFCREKTEIDRKLRSGGLCEDCVRSLGRMRVPVEPLRLALGVVRDLA